MAMLLFFLISQCSCPSVDDMTAVAQSDMVFEGVVDSVIQDSLRGYVFDVSFVIKGGDTGRVVVWTPDSCSVDFRVGGEYRVFSKRVDGRLITDACSGSYPIYSEEEYDQ